MDSQVKSIQLGWGWLMFYGIILLCVGGMVIVSPLFVAMALEILIGWLLIITGIFTIISCFGSRNAGGFFFRLLNGIVAIIFGWLILSHILATTVALCVLLAAFLIVGGIFKIVASIQLRQYVNWGWLLLSGILALALGIIWMKWPLSAAWVIGLFIGIDMLFGGWAMIMLSLSLKKAK